MRLYEIDTVAKQLSSEKPFFQTLGGSVYAVETQGEKPNNFRRMDKNRSLKGKARKQARREQRRMLSEALKFRDESVR